MIIMIHKDNFENNVETRLINPTRSEIGKVAKFVEKFASSRAVVQRNSK